MQNIIKFVAVCFLTITVASCKKEISKITLLGGTNPVLTAATTAPVVLSKPNENNTANTFTWTNPNYQLTSGLSSQDVTYTLQFDTTGSNFSNPNIQEKSVAKELTNTITVKELNQFMVKLNLLENVPHNMEVRVKTTLANNSAPLYSNVIKFIATPYLDVIVPLPTTDKLYLVGNATPGGDATGWNNPVPVPSQQFTKTSATSWSITIPLIGGKEYLILPLNGDWGHKYAVANKGLAGLNTGGDFGFDLGDNFPGPSASGNYRIDVDFKLGKFTVTKL